MDTVYVVWDLKRRREGIQGFEMMIRGDLRGSDIGSWYILCWGSVVCGREEG